MTKAPVRQADALLLDIGGVVLLSGMELVRRLAACEPAVAALSDAVGGIGSPGDALWQRMLTREVSEREYWADRAARIGEVFGERWDTRAMIHWLYDAPPATWLRAEALKLMADVTSAGLRLGSLTNDMTAFHGPEWVAQQSWLQPFDVMVDGSLTGVLKPDPGAYKLAVEALDVPAERIAFVDDMPWNVDAAVEAGILGVELDYDDPGAAFARARILLGLDAERE